LLEITHRFGNPPLSPLLTSEFKLYEFSRAQGTQYVKLLTQRLPPEA